MEFLRVNGPVIAIVLAVLGNLGFVVGVVVFLRGSRDPERPAARQAAVWFIGGGACILVGALLLLWGGTAG
ncbi:MAG: hypothetical protein JNM70_18425 [Anaerolineae bacterium]|nr:hypothetical protein [Anaerolineae bacterium]